MSDFDGDSLHASPDSDDFEENKMKEAVHRIKRFLGFVKNRISKCFFKKSRSYANEMLNLKGLLIGIVLEFAMKLKYFKGFIIENFNDLYAKSICILFLNVPFN